MYRLVQRLTPQWLQSLDRRLLLHDPVLWATRIHHVIFWSVLGIALAGFYGYYVPIGEEKLLLFVGGTVLMGLGSLVGFGLWWAALLHYPAWQQAGALKGWLSIRNLLVFLLGSALLSAIPVLYYELIAERWYHLRQAFAPLDLSANTMALVQRETIWQAWLFAGIPLLWLLTEMAAYLRQQQFVATIASAAGLITLLAFILEALGPGKDTALPLFIVMFLVAQVRLLVEWVYEDNPAKERGIWSQIIFLAISTLHIWIVPVAIVTAFQMNIYIENPSAAFAGKVVAWLVGLGLAMLMWHCYFRHKVLDLYLQPPE